jgi:hypothetical protein
VSVAVAERRECSAGDLLVVILLTRHRPSLPADRSPRLRSREYGTREGRGKRAAPVPDRTARLQGYADAEPATQHRIVRALFEQVEVLGPNEVWLYPSVEAEARGWAAAMKGESRVESTNGRGERSSAHTIQPSIRIELGSVANVPSYVQRATEIA